MSSDSTKTPQRSAQDALLPFLPPAFRSDGLADDLFLAANFALQYLWSGWQLKTLHWNSEDKTLAHSGYNRRVESAKFIGDIAYFLTKCVGPCQAAIRPVAPELTTARQTGPYAIGNFAEENAHWVGYRIGIAALSALESVLRFKLHMEDRTDPQKWADAVYRHWDACKAALDKLELPEPKGVESQVIWEVRRVEAQRAAANNKPTIEKDIHGIEQVKSPEMLVAYLQSNALERLRAWFYYHWETHNLKNPTAKVLDSERRSATPNECPRPLLEIYACMSRWDIDHGRRSPYPSLNEISAEEELINLRKRVQDYVERSHANSRPSRETLLSADLAACPREAPADTPPLLRSAFDRIRDGLLESADVLRDPPPADCEGFFEMANNLHQKFQIASLAYDNARNALLPDEDDNCAHGEALDHVRRVNTLVGGLVLRARHILRDQGFPDADHHDGLLPDLEHAVQTMAHADAFDLDGMLRAIEVQRRRSMTHRSSAEDTGQEDNKADRSKKKRREVPENPDVVKLARVIRRRQNENLTKIDIAREFCEGDEKKAQSLIRQLRRFSDL